MEQSDMEWTPRSAKVSDMGWISLCECKLISLRETVGDSCVSLSVVWDGKETGGKLPGTKTGVNIVILAKSVAVNQILMFAHLSGLTDVICRWHTPLECFASITWGDAPEEDFSLTKMKHLIFVQQVVPPVCSRKREERIFNTRKWDWT